MVKVERTDIPEVLVLTPGKYQDERGFLSETFSSVRLREAGIFVEFVQENHSYSASAGTVRGLHHQLPPFAQDKLIRVVQGSVYDVAVDLRKGSPSFGLWTAVEVSAEEWNQVFVPAGFSHGFCTLERDTHVLYKVSQPYVMDSQAGLAWNDPDLAIGWPQMESYVISDADRSLPVFSDFESPFRYEPA